jgi:phosphoglycolate phosphatase-like HAD superfamily hydrolase
MKQQINCIITDLDDTLWDWLEMWYNSFHPYFENIKKKFEIDNKVLEEDFKTLHQKYHTTEISFAYRELKTLNEEQKRLISFESSDNEKSIIHQYYSDKKNNLKLYDGVIETLNILKQKGVLIIAFTESNAFFTKYRIKQLGLDGLIDSIYTPLGYGIPESVQTYYDEDYWNPSKTSIRHLSNKDKKPNPEILEIIIADYNLKKDNIIYMGDKLDRDIQMALDVGITSVYASYGNVIESNKYELLRNVTHWSDEEVEREKISKSKLSVKKITPDFTVSNYSKILELFQFEQFNK